MTGPVFSERATTIVMPTERLAALVAYLHNNPVRAGVVGQAAESSWTSHRAWIGLEPAPSWLAVDPALQQAGFDGSEQGRRAFDVYVTQRCADARDPTCSPAHLRQARRQLRRHCGLPIEVSSPRLGADERMQFELGMRAGAGCPGRWDGDLRELLRRISEKTGVAMEEICSRSHRRPAVEARRLAVATATRMLGRRVSEAAAVLGIADSSASRLVGQGVGVMERARQLAEAMRGEAEGGQK